MRVGGSGRLSTSSRSHRSGARSRGSRFSGTADVTITATLAAATALRNSTRISVATGSGVAGSSASTSAISSTPPPSRTFATAAATRCRRSSAASAPTSGLSSSTSRRPAQTARTSAVLPTPAGPDTSTPKLLVAPRVCNRCGSSSASLSHSVSLAACALTPLRSLTVSCSALASTGSGCGASPPTGTPFPHVTNEFGCTLTGPVGSTPVTVNSSDVQLIPTAEASARVAVDVEVPGPRSRGSRDTASPMVNTLPSRACRSVVDGTDWLAKVEPLRVTDRAPYTVAAATITAVSSLSPALDSVTSSSSTVPIGICGPAMPATAVVVRDPVSDTASHSRMPRATMALGCSRITPRRESTAEVFSRAVSVSRAGDVMCGRGACAVPVAPLIGGWAAPGGSRAGWPAAAWVSHPTPRDVPPASDGCAPRTGCSRGRRRSSP